MARSNGMTATRRGRMRRMPRCLRLALVLATVLVSAAVAAAATTPLKPVKVAVLAPTPATANPTAAIVIDFHPQHLPSGGYYYAVAVLAPYHFHGGRPTPSCAVSSNMKVTEYGFPPRTGALRLTLTPTPSSSKAWCTGATYEGAVYAVPHKPPCNGYYRCTSGAAQCLPGRHVCGIILPPQYYPGYPGGLPKPIDGSSRIVGRFTVTFPFS
jgi:hypothetical protein